METFLTPKRHSTPLSSSACCAIAVAVILAVKVRAADAGTALMREIAAAIEEGAKAYLRRQIMTISAIAVVLFVLIFIFKGGATGARLSDRRDLLAAGRLHRHARGGHRQRPHGPGRDDRRAARPAHGLQRRRGHGPARGRPGSARASAAFISARTPTSAIRATRRRSTPSSAWRSAAASSRFSPVSAAASTPRRRTSARTSSARSSRTSTKTIPATRPPSPTTWATTWAIAPAWPPTCSRPMRSA